MLSITGGIVRHGSSALMRAARPSAAPSSLFTRSFTTTRVNDLPPSFFSSPSKRPTPAPAPRSRVTTLLPLLSRAKWSFARNGFIPETFATNHPWLASVLRLILVTVVGVGVVVGGVLGHDMFTYSKRHLDQCKEINPLAISPRLGGPKNLPIIEVNLDENQDAEIRAMADKPRIVILGGGWGAINILKNLPKDQYRVTVIAPENYFCFTPLLPSACVGTVEPRTLVEPLRRLIHRVRGHFLHGKAVDVCMAEQLVEVEIANGDSVTSAYVPYDKLIVAVGSRSNDHGVRGLENCFQLKTIPDAQAIRRRVMSNLEIASLPTTTPEERKRLLSFVVCGGGPTGVEIAAELADMLDEDVLDCYPRILQEDISVSIIQSRDHILNTYSEKISQFAEKRFKRSKVTVHTNARVGEVTPGSVVITTKDAEGKTVRTEIPSGLTVWSTGIAMQPFTKRMVEKLPNQYHSKAVQVDGYLRVEGTPTGTIYAIGDAATIHLNMLNDLLSLWEKFDTNKDGKLDYNEWKKMARYLRKKYTLASSQLEQIKDVFHETDSDKDGALRLNEVAELFIKLSNENTTLPPTAQVASQQGAYIGKLLKAEAKQVAEGTKVAEIDDIVSFKPFQYKHLGSLAYVGNSAVFDYYGFSIVGGLVGMYAWRSVYWSEQASVRSRFMLMLDWVKRGLFGRDLSKF